VEFTDKTIEKIRQIRKEKNITSEELGKRIGKTGSYIRHLERGKVRLSLEVLEDIAKALDVSIYKLLIEKDEIEEIEDNLAYIPVYGEVPAGDFKSGDLEVVDLWLTPTEMIKGYPKEAVAWVKVKGDSMKPLIKSGDRVLIIDTFYTGIKNGDVLIAVIDGESTLKKYYDKGDYIVLQPLNEEYEPIVIKKEELAEKPIKLYKVLWKAEKFY